MNITVKEAIELLQYCDKLPVKDMRLKYAFSKNVKILKTFLDDHNDNVEEIRIKHASEKDGLIVASEKGYDYSKADAKKLLESTKDLLKATIEFEPYTLPIIKELLNLGNGALAILDPILPENFIDSLEALQAEQEKAQ